MKEIRLSALCNPYEMCIFLCRIHYCQHCNFILAADADN